MFDATKPNGVGVAVADGVGVQFWSSWQERVAVGEDVLVGVHVQFCACSHVKVAVEAGITWKPAVAVSKFCPQKAHRTTLWPPGPAPPGTWNVRVMVPSAPTVPPPTSVTPSHRSETSTPGVKSCPFAETAVPGGPKEGFRRSAGEVGGRTAATSAPAASTIKTHTNGLRTAALIPPPGLRRRPPALGWPSPYPTPWGFVR